MALTITHLNGDASFLLSLEPLPVQGSPSPAYTPFRILLDPWITGPSTVFHSKISISTHKQPACVATLNELPEPDLVVISQHKTDHCNEATLRQLPASGTKTLILAEPLSARVIRSWKYFDKSKVRTIPKWDESTSRLGSTGSRQAGSVVRIPVPPVVPGGDAGEVTVAFIPQRRDITGLHSAVGITYRPPSTSCFEAVTTVTADCLPTRSASPASIMTSTTTRSSLRSRSLRPSLRHAPSLLRFESPGPGPEGLPLFQDSAEIRHLAPPSPSSPKSPSLFSLRSVRSASSLAISRQTSRLSTATTQVASSASSTRMVTKSMTCSSSSSSSSSNNNALSLLFSPHGISLPSLSSYVAGHLVPEAALPLTALLHCFDAVSNPWWLGGNILLGAPAGLQTVQALGARAWISAHDGEKELRGLATGLLRTRRYRREEVVQAATAPPLPQPLPPAPLGAGGISDTDSTDSICRKPEIVSSPGGERMRPTEVLALGIGEQVVLTSEGLWNTEPAILDFGAHPGLPAHTPQRPERTTPKTGVMRYKQEPEPSWDSFVLSSNAARRLPVH